MRSIEDIILEKKYDELSPEELVMVSELAENEEEFNQMKQLFDNMSFEFGESEAFEANPETKSSLDSIFTAKHPVIANDWKKEEEEPEVKIIPFYSQNWVRVAAVLLVFLGISVVYIQNAEELKSTSEPQQAKADIPKKSSTETRAKETESTDNKPTEPAETKEKVQLAVVLPPSNTRWTQSDMKTGYDDVSQNVANDKSASIAEQQPASGEPAVTLTYSTTGAYAFSTSAGLNSDLYPNGRVDQTKKAVASSGSTDVPASDMLDWIQAAY